jgi:hypothetical protein
MYAVGTKAAYQDGSHETYNKPSLEEGIGHGEDSCAQTALQQVDQCLGVPVGKRSNHPLSAIFSSCSVHCVLLSIRLSSNKYVWQSVNFQS